MDIIRKFLWFTFFFLSGLLWHTWQMDYANRATLVSKNNEASKAINVEEKNLSLPSQTELKDYLTHSNTITFKTDVLEGIIDTTGGHVIRLNLLQYAKEVTPAKPEPVVLLDCSTDRYYIAQTDVINSTSKPTEENYLYRSSIQRYALSPDQQTLCISLTAENKGIKITKQFILKRGEYQIDVKYKIENGSETKWQGKLYSELKQRNIKGSNSWFGLSSYTGGAFSTDQKPYEKISFDKMATQTLPKDTQYGWISFIEPYFTSAWISKHPIKSYYSYRQKDIFTLGTLSPEWTVLPGKQVETTITLYAGPKITEHLKATAKHLDLIVDYGIFWFFATSLFWLLKQFNQLFGNWGWAIVAVTLLSKLVFYKLSAESIRTTMAMNKLKPRLDALKKRYAENPQQLAKANFELYRREGIKPFRGGVLPQLLTIPITLGLYWVLLESVELRHQPFILWIKDLSSKDPYYILPILMGLASFIEKKLTPTQSNDPTQENTMLLVMPIAFTFFMLNFPAAWVLYWLVQNLFAIAEKIWILYGSRLRHIIFSRSS